MEYRRGLLYPLSQRSAGTSLTFFIGSLCVNTRYIQHCSSAALKLALRLGIVLVGCLSTFAGGSANAHTPFPADDVDLSAPCTQVHINVDPSLKGSITLEDESGLTPTVQTTRDGTEHHLHIFLKDCPKGGKLALRLSSDTSLTLHDSPQAHIVITGTLTTLEGNLEDTFLQVDRAESLDLSLSGQSQANIHQLDRAAQINLTNNAHLNVELALLSALSAQLSDTSQLSITQGQIDSLTLTGSNQSAAAIIAQINNATITTNDDAAITLDKVTGTLQDAGTKRITHINAPDPAATPSKEAAPARTPQPDGKAQGLTNPAVPTVPPQAASPIPTPQDSTPANPPSRATGVQPDINAPTQPALPTAPTGNTPSATQP